MTALNLPGFIGPQGDIGLQGPAGPYAPRHFARVYRNTAVSAAGANVVFQMIYDTKDRDDESLYNTTTGLYTCPEAGLYLVRASLSYQGNAATNVSARVYKNGAQYNIFNTYWGVASAMIAQIVDIIPAAVGDTFGIWGHSSIASISMRIAQSEASMVVAYLGT